MFKSRFLSNDTHKNYLQKILKAFSKQKHYETCLKENVGNPHKTWELLRSLLPQKSNTTKNHS